MLHSIFVKSSTGPAAEPSGRFPPPLLAGGGMGTPPVYWHTGSGDIYIAVHTVHGALGTLLRSFTAANVVGEPVDPFRWLKKPPALPFAAFHHPPWDYGIVFAYGPTPP
jgi:hypothetical protein